MTDEEFREQAREAIREFSPPRARRGRARRRCSTSVRYVGGHASTTRELYEQARRDAATRSTRTPALTLNRCFYLSTAPTFFPVIVEAARRRTAWTSHEDAEVRVVIEKPIGTNLAEARELNRRMLAVFDEHQVFRIDHYLGKETVQNIMAFRFANGMFEPVWNRNYIDHVQITAAEDIGVGSRAGYYDTSGALRDLVQNHMLQLLALHVHGAAGALHRRRGARREGQGAARRSRSPQPEERRPDIARARAVHAPGTVGGEDVPGLPRGGGRAAGLAAPRRTRRCASRSTTGAGRACRSTCAPASGWRARSPRSR